MGARKRPGIEARKNKDGSTTYKIRWRQGGTATGPRLSHTFAREREAIDAQNRIRASGSRCHCPEHAPPGVVPTQGYGVAKEKAGPTSSTAPTFSEYGERHADALTGVGDGYRRDVKRDVRLHFQGCATEEGRIVPGLGERPLDEITRLDVQEWIRGMETGAHWWLHRQACDRHTTRGALPCSIGCAAVRSVTTIRRVLAEAGAVMESATLAGVATRNPFRKHRLVSHDPDDHPHAEQVFLTHDEWEVVQACLPEGVYRDLATTLVGTGLRWGEVAALPVREVDLLASPPQLRVRQAWKKDGKGGVKLGPPKSARSRRTVTLSSAVCDALIPHVMGKQGDEFVFTTPRGRPLHHSNFYNKVWLPAVAEAQARGLRKRPRIHDLRHTHVSWLVADGVSIADVSRRVGHQSIHLTIDRYHHLLPQVDDAALAALERAMPSRRSEA